jgi:hypothetical protein
MLDTWPAIFFHDNITRHILDLRYGLVCEAHGRPLATLAKRFRTSEADIQARIDKALDAVLDPAHLAKSWQRYETAECLRAAKPQCPDLAFEAHLRWAWPALGWLTPREEMMLRLRWGFEGHCFTLREVGAWFFLSAESARKILLRAQGKLNDPKWYRKIRRFIDQSKT